MAWRVRFCRESAACPAVLLLAGLLLAALLLAAGAARADNRWPEERRAGQFYCHADFSLASEQPLLDEISTLGGELGVKLGAPPVREAVHLFLFQTKDAYQAYLKQHFPRVPYRRALFIKARGPGMVFAYRGTDFEIDVRHESTHALLHAWIPQLPLWLDEGLAEYFEMERERRRRQHPHHELIEAALRIGQLPQLEELELLDSLDDMGRDEYRNAWSWVHFLLHGPREAQGELVRYLADLAAGTNAGRLSDRLRRRLPDLNRRYAEHFRS